MKKTLIAIAASVTTLLGATNAAEYTLTVPHVANLDNYNHQSLLVFKNLVENRSNGRVEVKIYPSAQLCSTTKECMAGVQAGMFDYFQSTIAELTNYWQPLGASDLPYMFPNDRVAECVYDNEEFLADMRNNILKHTPNARLVMVSNSGGWRNIATTDKEIRSPDDMKGLKIRTVPNKIQQELVKNLGASPTPISWPEVYTALSTGMVQGTKNGIVDIIAAKFEESLDHITLDGHAYMAGAWVFADKKFKSFPNDIQRILMDGVEAQNQYLRSYPKHGEFSAYEKFKEAGGEIYNPTAEEKAQFKKAVEPVRQYFLDSTGAEGEVWLARLEKEIQTCEAQIENEYQLQLN